MRLALLALAALLWGCAPDSPPPAAPAGPTTSAPAAPAATPAGGPTVTGAWVRQMPPTARMTAGYLRVVNPGSDTLVIVGASSPQFGSVEVHGTIMEDGVMRMRQQAAVPVPPGGVVAFEPGGLHLMLMEAVDGMPTDKVQVALELEGGARLEFVAPVSQAPPD